MVCISNAHIYTFICGGDILYSDAFYTCMYSNRKKVLYGKKLVEIMAVIYQYTGNK